MHSFCTEKRRFGGCVKLLLRNYSRRKILCYDAYKLRTKSSFYSLQFNNDCISRKCRKMKTRALPTPLYIRIRARMGVIHNTYRQRGLTLVEILNNPRYHVNIAFPRATIHAVLTTTYTSNLGTSFIPTG